MASAWGRARHGYGCTTGRTGTRLVAGLASAWGRAGAAWADATSWVLQGMGGPCVCMAAWGVLVGAAVGASLVWVREQVVLLG